MSDWLLRAYRNIWPITAAVLVHVLLFALMSVNLDWTRQLKPTGAQPIQAVAIVEPLELPAPEPEPVPEPEPEPLPEPEPEPEPPKPEPAPKPVKTDWPYTCAGKELIAQSEEQARAMQADCEEQERKRKEEETRKKKEAEEKKRKEEEARKKKEAQEKKRKEEEARKKKELEEKKRKEAERKKKEAAEIKRKEAERKKKEAAERKRKAAAEKKRKEEAAKKAAAERALRAKLDKEGAQSAWGAAIGGAGGQAIARHVSNNYRYNPSCSGKNSKWIIEATPSGQILSINMTMSSGNDTCDREAGLAIKNSNPLPLHVDWPTAKPEKFEFNFRPE